MKKLFVVYSIVFAASCFADNSPMLVSVKLDRAFIPVGFDDNDNVQVTVSGVLPSNCYKIGPVKAEVDGATRTVKVNQTAYYYSGFCIPMVVPFVQTVSVGLVRDGDYNVIDKASQKTLGKIPISRSTTTNADDFLYAPINDVIVSKVENEQMMCLQGTFTDRCTKLKEVRVLYQPVVIVVQPIATRVGGRCGLELSRFQYCQPLNSSLTGTFLIHVRVMNGQAINKLVDLGDTIDPIVVTRND